MKQHILPALKLTAVCIVFFCGVYSLIVLGIAQAAPAHGLGETVSVNGKVVGFALEGQSFTQDKYFWGRPSAVGYNAAGSAGSNKGPTNPDYLKDVQSKVDTFLAHNPGIKKEDIPSELVTYSGGGLDPDISPAGAAVQVKRVAAVRGLPEEKVRQLVEQHTEGPLMGLFGPSKINVLKLNIALDNLH
ncbi:MAG: K(+)-transporting ATPase subunit C [Chitinophagaceae bacterium]|nr:K(+)-transporting ATPase subunit C [Chitinophagaceae bacterium]